MKAISDKTRRLLPYSFLKGVGAVTLSKLASDPSFQEATTSEIADKEVRVRKALEQPDAWRRASEEADYQIQSAEEADATILSLLDEDYPAILKSTKDDPCVLYVKGNLLQPHLGRSVAVIGTRKPTTHGEIITERISEYFISHGWSIVSGLALGCDSIAHQTVVKQGGHTVAVLAHGLQMISPKSNERLANEILSSGGALVSEYPFGTDASPAQFVKRDKTQAGLACGVVMIQSSLGGGSLHASRASISYGRWLAVPFPTKKDLKEASSVIGANTLLASENRSEIAALLKCDDSSLENLCILKGREDYASLIDFPMVSSPLFNTPVLTLI